MKQPNLSEEKKLWKKGFKRVAGLDESGRGPLAGPVIAAAVIITPCLRFHLKQIRDSKKLTPKKRKEIYKILRKNPQIRWGLGRVSEKVIDKINIKNAAELAMEKAVKNLNWKLEAEFRGCGARRKKTAKPSSHIGNCKKVDFLIIDGNNIKNLKLITYNLKLMVKGDEKVFSCAAASILAKVWRDRIMERYHKKFPRYGFDKHKGYPTKFHKKMLKKYGPCKIHRKSFRGVLDFFSIIV